MSSFIFASSAGAASSYDQVVNPVNSLTITESADNPLCATNLSASWADEFRSTLSGDMLASFDSRKAWSVSIVYYSEENYARPAAVYINWWEEASLPDTAIFNGNYLLANPTHRGGLSVSWNNGCALHGWSQPNPGSAAIAGYDSMAAQYSMRPFLLYGINVNYPTGYEGKYVPIDITQPIDTPPVDEPPTEEPPTPETPTKKKPSNKETYGPTTHTGTIDCGFKKLKGMMIFQDGVADWATLSNFESEYRATWGYNLTSSSYNISVNCGGQMVNSVGVVDPSTTSGDWICQPGTELPKMLRGWERKGHCVTS